jgi:predicted RNase H-like HicB family nuclease
MKFNIEYELETDGRWIAEIPSIPGAMVYGSTQKEAAAKVLELAIKAIADDIDFNSSYPDYFELSFPSS